MPPIIRESCEKMALPQISLRRNEVSYYWNIWRQFTLSSKNNLQRINKQNRIDEFVKRLQNFHFNHKRRNAKHFVLKKIENAIGKQGTNARNSMLQMSITEKNQSKTLKTQQLEKEINDSRFEISKTLQRSVTIFNPQLRSKAKALVALSGCRVSKSAEAIQRLQSTPETLKLREYRIKYRKKRWDSIQKKKKEIEEEKKRIKQETEEKIKLFEKMKENKKLKDSRERRNRLELAKKKRNEEELLLKEKMKMAEGHHTKHLMKNLGFQPWKKLIEIRNDQKKVALKHSELSKLKFFWKHWKTFTIQQIHIKYEGARTSYKKLLIKRAFCGWIAVHNKSVRAMKVSTDWANANLEKKVFRHWLKNFQVERMNFAKKEEVARFHFNRKITIKFFRKLRTFPEFLRQEEEKKNRKQFWRQKVQQVVPDYQPSGIYFSEIT